MTAFLVVAALVVAGIVVFVLVNKRAAGKVGFWGKSQLGRVGRAAEQNDPTGQMRQAADDAGEKIGVAREAWARAKASQRALERQVATDTYEITTLTGRINRKLDGGAPPTDPDIVRWSAELARAKRYKAENEAQLAVTINQVSSALADIQAETYKVEDLKKRAERLDVQLDLSKATAAVAELTADHGAMDAVNSAAKFEEIARRQIDENSAKLEAMGESARRRDETADADLAGASALDEILAARKKVA